jgi:arylsulfatase A-like enzyme
MLRIIGCVWGLLSWMLPAEELARPNVIWITSEDNSASWLGCYGNAQAQTPTLDALAARSVVLDRAYTNAAVCAVARSTILRGMHAVTQGTLHMRSRPQLPNLIIPYVTDLRGSGYFCTNNAKTDYNWAGNDAALWDQCNGKAHYKNRKNQQPFFAVFNFTETHESSLFENQLARRKSRLDPAQVVLPPFVPDLPEMRSDFAHYHDCVTRMDARVKEVLDELEASGEAENTIVFYYSDHGGATPRGKRYLYESGVRVPLMVHVPKRWQQLCSIPMGQRSSELVSFVDFAPTLLSLCEVKIPASMQGRPFLGKARREPAKDDVVFFYADRFDEIHGMRRAISDGRYKYMRHFTPSMPTAPYSFYQFGQAGWRAWHTAWKNDTLKPEHRALWESPTSSELLFDLQNDPHEMKDLSQDPAMKERLLVMRQRLQQAMIENFDTGLVPEPMFDEVGATTIHEHLHQPSFDRKAISTLAFAATSRNEADLPALLEAMASDDPVKRYWGAQGCVNLGKSASKAQDLLKKLLDDKHPAVAVSAAHAMT